MIIPRLLRSSLLVITMLTMMGCEPGVTPPTCDSVLSIYDQSSRQLSSNTKIERVEIYIDGSVPMRNFLRKSASKTKTRYTRLLEFMGTNPWETDESVLGMKFGIGKPTVVKDVVSHGLTLPANDRGFYDLGETHIAELVDDFTNSHERDEGVVRIVVTDLVQSNKPSKQNPQISNWAFLANKIRAWLRVGDWQLVAMQSKYVGKHYPECGVKDFNVPRPVERPFYLMIFADNQETADLAASAFLEGEGTDGFQEGTHRFRPRAQMARISWLSQHVPQSHQELGGQTNQLMLDFGICDGKVVELNWNKIEQRRSRGLVELLLRGETDDPAESFVDIKQLQLETSVKCYDWVKPVIDSVHQVGATLPANVTVGSLERPESDSGSSVFFRDYRMCFTFRPSDGMLSGHHYIYQFTMKAKPTSLRLPEWVRNWSCDNDNKLTEIAQTLNLERVLGAVMRHTNTDCPLFAGFFIIHGR